MQIIMRKLIVAESRNKLKRHCRRGDGGVDQSCFDLVY